MKNKILKISFLFLVGLMLMPTVVFGQYSKALEDLREVGDPTKLPGFDVSGQHANAAVEEGAAEITSVGLFMVDAVKYVIGTIAFFLVIISAVKLITAGKDIEDAVTKEKELLKYSAFAFVAVMVAEPFVKKVFFGVEGEVLTTETYAKEFATEGSNQIMGIINFVEFFIATIAVLMIIISGLTIILSAGEEETRTKHIKHIVYAVGGLILVGLSELLVKGIIFPQKGSSLPDLGVARLTIQNITNYATSFIAFISVAVAIYGGYLYVFGAANDENTQKAKKVILGAIIGIIIAMAAFAIVNTLLPPPEAIQTTQPPTGSL